MFILDLIEGDMTKDYPVDEKFLELLKYLFKIESSSHSFNHGRSLLVNLMTILLLPIQYLMSLL